METTLGSLLTQAGRKFGDKAFVIAPDRSLSFREVDEFAARFAARLKGLNIGQGDRVTLWLENGWRWIVAYFAILKLGAVVNPANILQTADEVQFFIKDCGATVLIASGDKLAGLQTIPTICVVVGTDDDIKGRLPFDQLLEQSPRDHSFETPFDLTSGSIAAIAYTSGTTGFPKGALLTHGNIILNATMTSLMHGRIASDVVVTALPSTHVYGNIVIISALVSGASVVLFPRFDEGIALAAIQAHRATIFEGVPAMYLRILNHPASKQFDSSSLRICTVGGQTMAVSKMEEVEQLFKCRLIELWGMTELAGLGTTHPHNGPPRLGSIGTGLPFVETKIVDVTDVSRELPLLETGELMVRGPITMRGYLNNAEATNSTFERDGWMHTGDLAHKDGDGFIVIVDRAKDVIISGGYNVYPAEVERVIAAHPGVAIVAVAAMNHDTLGQAVAAFVVRRDDLSLTIEELIHHCRQYLASYKVPKQVTFMDDLPRTSTGKISRRALQRVSL